MRAVFVLTMLAACGRVAFDEIEGPPAPDTAAPRCAAGFDPVPDAPLQYRFEVTPVSWSEALETCRGFGPGHSLALPTSDAERLALGAAARAKLVDRWWLGGTDEAMEGVWIDPEGAPIDYQPWAPGEPNNTGEGGENCLDILADPIEGVDRTDRFDDRACGAAYPFICVCTLGD